MFLRTLIFPFSMNLNESPPAETWSSPGLVKKKKKKKKKKRTKDYDTRLGRMKEEINSITPSVIPSLISPNEIIEKTGIKETFYNKIRKYRKKLMVGGIVTVGLIFIIVIGYIWAKSGDGDDPNVVPKKTKKKKKGKTNVKNGAELRENYKAALKEEYEVLVERIRELESRSESNQVEAMANSKNFNEKHAIEDVIDYTNGIGGDFSSPEEKEREKVGMMMLQDELKNEMEDIQEEYTELTARAKEIEAEFHATEED